MAKPPRYRGHPLAYLVSIGLFTVVAIGAILLTRGYTIDVSTGALRKTGLLVLGSHPKDAFITIDGDVKDVRTRSRLTLIPGTYEVTVDLPDTHPWQNRIGINPGDAVIEEDILLFRDRPERLALSDGPAVGAALDAPAKRVAFLRPEADGVGLFVRNTDGRDQSRRLALLPPNYASPTSLTWSNDGSRVAVSVSGETRIVPTGTGSPVTIPLGGRTALAPGQTDALIVDQGVGTIVRVRPDGTVEPLETSVTSWTVTPGAAYFASAGGDVIRRVRDDRQTLSAPPQVSLVAAPDADRAFGISADGTATVFTSGIPERLAAGVERIVPSRNGEQAVYVRQREVRLWNEREQTDDLLSRFTDVPPVLAVLPGGAYALFGNGTAIEAIAADGSNPTDLTASEILVDVINLETLLVRGADGSLSALEIVSRD